MILSKILYFLGLASQYYTVIILQSNYNSDIAVHFIQITSLIYLFSGLFELGIPTKIHWSLITQNINNIAKEPSQKIRTVTTKIESIINLKKLTIDFIVREFRTDRPIKYVATLTIIIYFGVLLHSFKTQYFTLFEIIIILLSTIVLLIRKFYCLFAEGLGAFTISRLSLATAPSLFIVIIWIFNLYNLETSRSQLFLVWLACNTISLAIIIYHSNGWLKSTEINLQQALSKQNVNSSASWSMLGIATVINSNLFILLSPFFLDSEQVVSYFLFIKLLSVAIEIGTIYSKEIALKYGDRFSIFNINFFFIIGIAIATISLPIGWFITGSHFPILIQALILIDSFLMALISILATKGLIKGLRFPYKSHLTFTAIKTVLLTMLSLNILSLTHFFGLIILTGLVSSYYHNYKLYEKSFNY